MNAAKRRSRRDVVLRFERSAAKRTLGRIFRRSLFASWFDRRDPGEIGRKFFRLECLNVHFHEADEWATEVWFIGVAAVDDYADCRDNSAMLANDVDCLLNPSAARDDVLGDNKLFTLVDPKSAAQGESARFFLDKYVAFAQGA